MATKECLRIRGAYLELEEVVRMRFNCTNCGNFIVKSALSDPYMCRDCEKVLEGVSVEERYAYLDNLH